MKKIVLILRIIIVLIISAVYVGFGIQLITCPGRDNWIYLSIATPLLFFWIIGIKMAKVGKGKLGMALQTIAIIFLLLLFAPAISIDRHMCKIISF